MEGVSSEIISYQQVFNILLLITLILGQKKETPESVSY